MRNQPRPLAPVPDADLAWCHEAVQDVSRTFALTIDLLEEPTSSYICTGYLLCRIADTIEDTTAISPADKIALLDQYDRVLDPATSADPAAFAAAVEPHLPGERTAEWQVVAHTERVLATFNELPPDVREAMLPPIRELVGGMSEFVEAHADRDGIRIQTEAALEAYCYYVAGTVGHLVTNLVTREVDDDSTEARLGKTAEDFGLLLQLVNVAKDVHADFREENNVYLPATWLAEVGVAQSDVLAGDRTDDVTRVIERTVRKARSYLDDAQVYLDTLETIDRNTFVAWAVPYLLAIGTLRELSARPADALSPGGVKISREEVAAVVATMASDTDRRSLSALRTAVSEGDFA